MTLLGVIILNMDGVPDASGDYLDSTSFIRVGPQVDVLDGHNGWPLGRATNVHFADNKFLADIEFFDVIPEHVKLMKPAFAGKCHVRNGRHIVDCELKSIELTSFNVDDRIPVLSHYVQVNVKVPTKIEVTEKECKCHSILFGHDDGCPWKR